MEPSEYLQYLKPSKRKRQKRRDKRLYEELIECRRDLGGKKNKSSRRSGLRRQRQQQARTGYPYREPMCTRGGNHSWPADNLEPLVRWLQTNCGCPWDEVHSRLIRQLDTRSTIGRHVLDHLWEYVCIRTRLVDGRLVYTNRWGAPKEQHRWFFVHPETGILHSNRYEEQKGPFPQKARWKLEKAERMRGPAKGKAQKSRPQAKVYHSSAIQTKGQRLLEGEAYTLVTRSFTARVQLLSDRSNRRYGLFLFLEVLFLECSLHWLVGMKQKLFYREEMGEVRWVLS
jgi:hypothetical protein